MVFLFQKYKNLGTCHAEKINSILQSLHVIVVTGVHNVGKKTAITNIKHNYNKVIFVKENLNEIYTESYNTCILCNHRYLLYLYPNKKDIHKLNKIIDNIDSYIHIVIICKPSVSMQFASRCFVYKIPCPTYEMLCTCIRPIAITEYENDKYVCAVCEKSSTYHDALILLELYHNGLYEHRSFVDNIDNVFHNYLLRDKMTKLQLRNTLYKVMMHLTLPAIVMNYMLEKTLKSYPNKHNKLCTIAANCEHDYVRGNKEIYHYENMIYQFKAVINEEKKSK